MKKVVLKLDYTDEKVKQKAMKKVSSLNGVESISIDKDKKLTVTGSIDPVSIVGKLRKICNTEIVSVGPKEAEKKKEDGKKDEGKKDEGKKDEKKDDKKKGGGDDKKKDEPAKAGPVQVQVPLAVAQQYYYHQQQQQQQQHPYYNQQHPYYHQQQYPPPYSHPAYYNGYRSVEEDPNGSCVIC